MNPLAQSISDEDLVEILYATILKRTPDVSGFKNYTNRILNLPRKEALNILINNFINSEEYKKNLLGNISLKSIVNNRVQDKNTIINHIISLGTTCYTSQLLKKADLKKYSGPFDWIFSSPAMVAHVIDDDFNIFLDKSHHKNIPTKFSRISGTRELPVAHQFYLDNYSVSDVFNHHDVNINEDYNYFTRAIERFRKVLLLSEPVMFVICTKHSEDTHKQFKMVSSAILKRKSSLSCLRYISIEEGDSTLPTCEILDNSIYDFELIHFKSSSKWKDLNFENLIDDIAILNIISRGVNFKLMQID